MTLDKDLLMRWLEQHESKWGTKISREKWFNNIIEECAELIQAVQHYKRKRVSFSDVRIEMADVIICIETLLALEDPTGPPIVEDIHRIARYQIDILDGEEPQIHNDGEDNPPLAVEA